MAEIICAECGQPGSVMLWVGNQADGFYSCSGCWRTATAKLVKKTVAKKKKKKNKARRKHDDDDPLLHRHTGDVES